MRAHAVAALLVALLAGCSRTPASPPEPPAMTDAPKPTARVLTLPPASGRTKLLLVLLHGVGASADSFMPIARALAPAVPDAEFVVLDGLHPFDGGTQGRQWFSLQGITEQNRPARVRQAGAEVSAWLDGALKERGLGAERVVLLGFSQGAILAQWLALHRQPAPLAVVSLSGRLAVDAPAVPGSTSVPVLLVHGARDPVIPARFSEEAARELEARGARVRLRLFPTLAHGVDAAVLDEVQRFLADTLPAD
ncbi:alpha/beta hydrolase [Corallococcus exiguus]|uniref:alpha/beta hydrolase n=1 Tax=Corallococcus exiguus TaxID=83462 RepID=UPI001494A50D|nr:alpha/beta fold hydrolase [Corallococcus exiguus]NPD23142.1 alpha/beta fold hydrolase [Corallococcus exiguus]